MGIQYRRMQRSQPTPRESESLHRVDALATQLEAALTAAHAAIDSAHVYRASSAAVQVIVSAILKQRLGFDEELLLTPQDGIVSRPRPDFYFSLGPGEGVIAEVERGGTVNNNHDLKDMWKVHIAKDAQHLFLIVPNSNWTESGSPRERPFPRVVDRMSAFFGDSRREIDVLSCHVFGYGREL